MVKLLLIVVTIVVGAVAGGDFAVRSWASGQLESIAHEEIAANGGGNGETDASVGSFPFVPKLLLSGRVSKARVRQHDVPAGPVTLQSVTVDLRDVDVSRDRLLRDREVEITDIGSGTVTAVLTDDEVSKVAGVPVTFDDGRATATVAGVAASAGVAVEGGVLVIRVGSLAPVRLLFPNVPLLPCVADVEVDDGVAELGCTIRDVPPELVRAANRAAS